LTPRETLLASMLAVATAACFWLGAKAFGSPSPPSPAPSGGVAAQYDPAESASKLRRIGHALRLYREEFVPVPVAQRRSPEDASIPWPNVLAQPGHPWSLDPSDLKLSSVGHESTTSFSSFVFPLWNPELDLNKLLPETGERQVYAVDFRFFPESRRDEPVWQALVLRVDGTVEVLEYPRFQYVELARR
jgi:hypothetical protein